MAKRIIFPSKATVALANFEPPQPAEGEISIETIYSLISIGTETTILHQKYDPDTHFARRFSFPQLKTGVQAIGKVRARGANANDFAVGDLVYMRMAHGSHQVLPERICSPVPTGIDLKKACWCGLAKTAFRGAWAAQAQVGSAILIIGAGPVGQMATRWLAAASPRSLAVADLSPSRLRHAERGGASIVFEGDIANHMDAIRSMGDSDGPAIVIDTTGNPAAFSFALEAAAPFGKVILLGDTGYPDRQHLSSAMMTKGLTVQATHDSHDRDGWTQRRIDSRFFDLVARDRFNLDGLITEEFAPEDCTKAYEAAEYNRAETMGLLFDWTRRSY